MNWIGELIWTGFMRRFFYYKAATAALEAVLQRPFDTTSDQDIDLALKYADQFMDDAERRYKEKFHG